MPSIQALVADLHNRSIVGIGAKPGSHLTNLASEISETCRVMYSFVHMNATLSGGNRLSCGEAQVSANFNGSYLHFKDNWSTIANMDINRPIVASGNFSGCAYKVFRSEQAAMFKCAHIARPAGAGSDALVGLMTSYAGQKQWTELQSITTAGHIGVNGCAEVFIVSQLFLNQRIDTVMLDINNQGLTVGSTLVSTPI